MQQNSKNNEIINPVNYVKCNLCGANDYKIVYHSNIKQNIPTVSEYTSTINKYGSYHNIVKCNICGLIYMDPRDRNILGLYKEVYDESYIQTWEERALTFRKHLNILQKYKPSGYILDMGCYAGIFIKEAQNKAYQICGIEPSTWAVDYAQKKTGAEIINGSCEVRFFENNIFDIVTLWDVIEHLEDPSLALSLVYDYLKTDGIIAITTHDIGSLLPRLLGKKYPWLMRFHLYHFTHKTLKLLLKKNGFETVFIKYYSKRFSLDYLLSRFNIKMKLEIFKKIIIPINTFDGIMIIAKKSQV